MDNLEKEIENDIKNNKYKKIRMIGIFILFLIAIICMILYILIFLFPFIFGLVLSGQR